MRGVKKVKRSKHMFQNKLTLYKKIEEKTER